MIRLNEHKYEQLNFNYFSIECYSFRILVGLFSFIHLEFDAYVMNILLNRYHFDMENVAEYVICFSFFFASSVQFEQGISKNGSVNGGVSLKQQQ